ncbi:RabGAP/TBC [Neoconidiobolus thromboides FSU 785]|nr:RabGAP/TBC [Neoconidiobolus thromboides FSU 785]
MSTDSIPSDLTQRPFDAFSAHILENDVLSKRSSVLDGSKRMSAALTPVDANKKMGRRLTIRNFKKDEKDHLIDRFKKENEKYISDKINSTDFLIARLDKIEGNTNVEENQDVNNTSIHMPSLKSDIIPEELSANYVPTSLPVNQEPDLSSSSSESCTSFSPVTSEEGKVNDLEVLLSSSSIYDSLPDWEFWCTVVQDYAAVARRTPHLLSAKIRLGIPSVLRGALWQTMSQSGSTYLETLYYQVLEEKNFSYEKIILRDLPRTFPRLPMFSEESGTGQRRLFNVMKAYSLYDTEVGYCQGLGFMVGPLLMNMPEVEAFCVFVRLMETYDMRTMFTVKMEGLRLRLYQLGYLIAEMIPELANHLSSHNLSTALYASQWFLSLFAYSFPLTLVQRIFDVVFAEGAPETIMRIAIALLKKNEQKLLAMDEFESLISFLTSAQLLEIYDNSATRLINDAIAISSEVSTSKLNELAQKYSEEPDSSTFCQQKTSLNSKSSGWMQNILSSLYPEGSFRSRSLNRNNSHASILSNNGSDSPSAFFMNPEHTATIPRSANRSNSDNTIPTTELEALRLAVHDLQTTSETHLTALTQLRHDHSVLKSDMVHLKAEKYSLQEENELLRHELLKAQKQGKEYLSQGRQALLRQQEHIQSVEKQLLESNMQLKELQDERDNLLRVLQESNIKGYPNNNVQNNFTGAIRKLITRQY